MNEADVSALCDRLLPILRSITGPGIRKSIDIFGEYMPLVTEGVRSGEKVFDWTVPKEWQITAATLTGPDGETIADLAHSNLSVVSYSTAVDGEFDLDALQPHLHSIPSLPDATPYVTSYYKRHWGFCLPHSVRIALKPGRYKARIDAQFVDGEVPFAHCVLPGESGQEILLSSYLCHPSMANNELSGPLVLLMLFNRLSAWPRRRYSYRFLLNPETIGALCFLARYGEHLRSKLAAGFVLTCLGGPEAQLSYKATRRENALNDVVVSHLRDQREAIRWRPFSPAHGSDERQYCSPGFNLPVGQFARTLYGEYPGYHNSLDTKEFMGIKPLFESADVIERVLKAIECGGYFTNLQPYGEPQLGPRGLYPNINSAESRVASTDTVMDGRRQLEALLMTLNYSDGRTSMTSIARMIGCSVFDLEPIVAKLEVAGLLKLDMAR